ncbi:MAG: hypothetical protein RJQ09_09340 [Cyclobacteriaceae bacterium]
MEDLWIILPPLIFILFQANNKIHFISLRKNSKKLRAKVVEYRKEKVPIRNDFTRIDYPFVVILSETQPIIRKLRYSSSWRRPFRVGDEIDVFFNGSDLLYWNAFDKGLNKFLPYSWKTWK